MFCCENKAKISYNHFEWEAISSRQIQLGSQGPQTAFTQLALQRAGFDPGPIDGKFGPRSDAALRSFQRAWGLFPDGVAGIRSHAALLPYYSGFTLHTVGYGDSLYRIAARYGTTLRAVEIANPGADPLNLRPGEILTVPLPFPVVPTNIPWYSELVDVCCEGIVARYPFIKTGSIGSSVLGKPLRFLRLGRGNRIFYNAAHHANEWITTPLLFRFVEELAYATAFDETIDGRNAVALLERAELTAVPCVNPDGLDLVTGELSAGAAYDSAREIAESFPQIPFPRGWKANIEGIDPNLQYPAGWEQAREIKYAQGFTRPAPRDFVGEEPLIAPESRAVYDFTLEYSPALTLSYHTQGGVIYWKYLDYEPPRSREIAYRFGAASDYLVESTPYASGFAGYKDWFIQDFNRPGYTIEAGRGENPLPLEQFEQIYKQNLGILISGLSVLS